MAYLKTFAEITSADETAGGKGASLAEMVQAGFKVPDGFVILTPAYDEFLQKSGLSDKINNLLSRVNINEMPSIESASDQITGHILEAGVSTELSEAINQAFERLNAESVAIRSSATAEDGTQAAWAGQLDTFLNTSKKDLTHAVKKCWASLFTPRAIFYRLQQNMQDKPVSVAVVVQAMVQSEVSGTAFSVHPVSEDPNQLIIEAGLGLGESIVSGEITPDSYVVAKNPLKIISKHTHTQEKALYKAKSGGSEYRKISGKEREKQVLTDKEILELTQLIKQVESHYGFACDIEWAKIKDEFYLLQCRPITTLHSKQPVKRLDEEFLSQNGGDKIMRFEGDFMLFQLMIEWWNYYDLDKKWQGIYPVMFFFTPERTTGVISLDKYRGIAVETFSDLMEGRRPFDDFKNGYQKYAAKIAESYKTYFVDNYKFKNENDVYAAFKSVHKDFQELVAWTLFYEQLDESAAAEVLDGKEIDLHNMWEIVKLPVFVSLDTRKKQFMLSALEGSVSARYLCFAFSDYTFFADEKFVKKELARSDKQKLKAQIKSAQEASDKAKNQLKKYLTNIDPLTKKAIEILQWVLFCRDERKDTLNQAELVLFHLSRQLFDFWDIDKDLVVLTGIAEIMQGRDYVRIVADDLPKRRDGFAGLLQIDRTFKTSYEQLDRQIENLDQVILSQHQDNTRAEIKGEIGNRGQIEGKVRIVRKRVEFDSFKTGEILVTGMTRPEFVPLMEKAAGIITDEGGITSHAAIVSRELNKPCIIGTKVATQLLKTGDTVVLDANIGVVRLKD